MGVKHFLDELVGALSCFMSVEGDACCEENVIEELLSDNAREGCVRLTQMVQVHNNRVRWIDL